jgi:hypothetical protein
MNHSRIAVNSHGIIPSQNISSTLWLHIIVAPAASIFLLPLIFILKRRAHRFQGPVQILSVITIALGTLLGFFQRNNFHSTSHGLLGCLVFLLSVVYLAGEIGGQKLLPSALAFWTGRYLLGQIVERILPLLIYTEIILGFIAM